MIKVAQIVLAITVLQAIHQWQQAILTIFNSNRTSYPAWACMVCHHFMAIFTVSDRYDFCIFFDPGRFYAHDKVNVSSVGLERKRVLQLRGIRSKQRI